MRYGKIFRGLKVGIAESFGCVGAIIYSDPADDGYSKGET
jgi:N-acetylated-alpha-linked acidic dipeptidase